MIATIVIAASMVTTADAALLAIRRCAAGEHAVSAAIVGGEGELRALLRGDGAPPHSPEAARRKAYTALSFEQPTEALAALVARQPDAAALKQLDGTLFVGGGVPVRKAGRVVGGVGVSGAKGPGFDERCARAAATHLEEATP